MATDYEKNINKNVISIPASQAINFLKQLGVYKINGMSAEHVRPIDGTNGTALDGVNSVNDIPMTANGNTYTIKQAGVTKDGFLSYNWYDLTAAAKAAGYSYEAIAKAWQASGHKIGNDNWTAQAVEEFNSTTASEQLYQYLATRGYADVSVETHLKPNGKGYDYYVTYTDSKGNKSYFPVPGPTNGQMYDNELEIQNAVGPGTTVGVGLDNAVQNYQTQQTQQQTISNAKKGITAIDTALGVDKDGNPVGDGKGIFKSGTDARVTLAKGPDTSTQVVGNQANDFFTDKNLGTDVMSLNTQSNGGANYDAWKSDIQAQKDATTKKTDTQIEKTKSALLSAIQNDDELYKAVSALLQSSDPIGRKAGAALSTAQEANKGYKKTADDSNEQLSGLAAEQRQALYDADKTGLEGYVKQQLDQMMSALRDESNKADAFTTLASMIAGAINAEIAQMTRQTKDEISKADSETAKSITGNNVLTTDASDTGSFLTEYISKYVGEDVDLETVLKGIADSKTQLDLSDVPKSSFKEIPYIDETTLARLQQDPILKEIFSEDYYKKVMSSKNEKDLADEYGIGFLIDSDGDADKSEDFVKMYTDFAKGANAASDKTFNAAQKAYLSALAAGDVKTIQQLTKLADTASAPKSNLYGASALAAQFSQQRQNSNVADSQAYDRVLQQAANDELLAKSKTEGKTSWTSYMGDGNTTTGSSLRGGEVLSGENKNKYGAGYGVIFDAGMKDQSSINDNISTVNDTNRSNSAAVDNNNMANLQKIKSIKKGLLGSRNGLQAIVDKGI